MFFDIPNKDGLWVYNNPNTWLTWVKPGQFNNFIFYICGGGGGGRGAPTGNLGNNGGGGGSGGQLLTMNAPSYLLPETLYINIGQGGAGGLSNNAGSAGETTYLCYYPNINSANVIAPAAGGGGGNPSTFTPASVSPAFNNQTIFSITSSQSAGAISGSGQTGGNFSSTACCVYGGASGGGRDFSGVYNAGGNINGSEIHPTLFGSGGDSFLPGTDGYLITKPFTALGGSGSGAGSSGKGGNGTWGSGGGGAGAGSNSAGGRGGNGFVIIIGY